MTWIWIKDFNEHLLLQERMLAATDAVRIQLLYQLNEMFN